MPSPAHAYIGPGAGFAFVSSFFILFATFFLAFIVLLTFPLRLLWRALAGRRALGKSRAKQVVILGLDGQDPGLTEQFMAEGILPNFSKLRAEGTFARLGTTLLAESPVAWSSFQTGCNPGKHRIYDFLAPDRRTCLPMLSSAEIRPPARSIKLGPYRIPLGKPRMTAGRKSQPFWKILGDHGVFSTVLRVPITFPPEKFWGVSLSAMSVPDLKGSQGVYFYYTSDPADQPKLTSGLRLPLERAGGATRGEIDGPENPIREGAGAIRVPFEVRAAKSGAGMEILIQGRSFALPPRKFTPWIGIDFKAAPGVTVRGLARFCLLEAAPHIKIFMTPLQIDPGNPALPISHPPTYAAYLAKTQGPYATLGIAEDTSALNEGIIDEAIFLEECQLIHGERERMWFDALEKTRRGLAVCVFDITDRVQHMAFRYLEADHPANRGKESSAHRGAIRDLYRQMDDLVGRTIARIDKDAALFVMSDHGFKPFRRAVNLNTWLWKRGFLALKTAEPGEGDMFRDVDWSRTQAYAIGFGGIFLNLAGREGNGALKPGAEAEDVKRRIREGLRELVDPENGKPPVAEVYDAAEAYSGPYAREGPDLIVGFHVPYRVAWSSVTGGFSREIIEDNDRRWSGDHNFDPPEVPGMLFSNRRIAEANPSIVDLAPTVLDLFGVEIPKYFDGKPLLPAEPSAASAKAAPAPRAEGAVV